MARGTRSSKRSLDAAGLETNGYNPENRPNKMARSSMPQASQNHDKLETHHQDQHYKIEDSRESKTDILENPYPTESDTVSKNSVLAETVKCKLVVVLESDVCGDIPEIEVKWLDKKSYQTLELKATECLNSKAATKVYRKSGRCRLLRCHDKQEFGCKVLESEHHWPLVPQLLIAEFFVHNHRNMVPFYLEIQWVYSALYIPRVQGQRYAVTLRIAIESKMKENWEGDAYVPRRDLVEIFSGDTVRYLVIEDGEPGGSTENLTTEEREKFAEDIKADATRLLALCIYARLPLECLHQLLMNGLKDSRIPLSLQDCPDANYTTDFRSLVRYQGGFMAHQFTRDNRPLEIKKEIVVPIIFDEKEDLKGEGAYGIVYKVMIDPDHHVFPSDANSHFALKIFFEHGRRTKADFENETRMLNVVTKRPHEHITMHLASWTHKGKFFMLFHCAHQNLRQFLQKSPHPELTKETILWILSQLKGLAEALKNIHIMGTYGDKHDRQNSKHESTMFHHDLKPENILVFTGPKYGKGIFKIGDFGCGRIGLLRSGSGLTSKSPYLSNLPPGDSTYGAPDFYIDGKTSRPYDMWSLGCVFLEILMWTFGLQNSDLDDFAVARAAFPATESNTNPTASYWYLDEDSVIHLKRPVIERLRTIKEHCKDKGVFRGIVRITNDMLCIIPKDRIKIPDVAFELEQALVQAEYELDQDPDFYTGKIQCQDRVVASPSSMPADRGRRPSIDDRSVYAAFGSYLRPELTPRHHRSSSQNSLEERQGSLSPLRIDMEHIEDDRQTLSVNQFASHGRHKPRSPSLSITQPDGRSFLHSDSVDLADQTGVEDPEALMPWARQNVVASEDLRSRSPANVLETLD